MWQGHEGAAGSIENPACTYIYIHAYSSLSASRKHTVLRIERSEFWDRTVKMTWPKHVRNQVVYRIWPLLLECLIARIRLPNDMSLNLAPPALQINVELVMKRLKAGYLARCGNPILRRGRNEYDEEGSRAGETRTELVKAERGLG